MGGAFARDLRYGLRTLRRSPVFTLVAAASLALGIGATTAVFTFVEALLLQPVPVHQPSRLVSVFTEDQELPGLYPVSFPNYEDLRDQSRTLSGMAAYMPIRPSLSREERPLKLDGALVSANYFDVLGVTPFRGRFFGPDEGEGGGGAPVVVVTHRLWRDQLGADPSLVGRAIPLNGAPYTVVGIARPGFVGADVLNPVDVFLPLPARDRMLFGAMSAWFDVRGALMLRTVGRLADGATTAEAETEIANLSRRLAESYPEDNEGREAKTLPFLQATISPNQRGSFVLGTGLLAAAVVLILLIACVNVANLVLARGARRRRELAVRLALGSGRARLASQLFAESLLLALLGGLLGLGVAYLGRRLLWGVRPPEVPATLDVSFDGRVLLFAFGLTLLTGLLFGVLPALRGSNPNLVDSLKSGGRGASSGGRRLPLPQMMVACQVALSLVVLVGAGLFLRALQSAQEIDLGFDSKGMVVASFDLAAQGYGEEQARELYRRAVEEIESAPDVKSATIGQNLPFVTLALLRPASPEDYVGESGEDTVFLQYQSVAPRYFETLGLALRAGRGFTDADREGSRPVVVVNETTASRLWPGRSAIGRRLTLVDTESDAEVVGVVEDAKYNFLGEAPQLYVYVPLLQEHAPAATLFVRTDADRTDALVSRVREQMHRLDPRLPLYDLEAFDDVVGRTLWAPRLGAVLLGLLGMVAVALAAVGVYGVMAYAVGERTREIGIRVALGAERSSILSLVLARGLRVVAIGLVLGLLLAWISTRSVTSLLFGVPPLDPLVFGATTALLAAVALFANYLPARRATKTDPVVVLDHE